MYNFHLPVSIDTSKEYILQGFSLPINEFSEIEAFVKSSSGESFAILQKPAMLDDSNQITYYCLESSADYVDEDHTTSELLRFNKATRTLTDALGRCGEEFFTIALGKCIRIFYDKKWHALILKVLKNNQHHVTLI